MTTPSIDVDTQAIAHRVMYELLGRRWVWPPVTTTEHHDTYAGQRSIVLMGKPVIEVLSVLRDGSDVELTYTLENGHRLRLDRPTRSALCDGSDHRIHVRYSYGSPAPEAVEHAITVLKAELDKSLMGDASCRLPQRVTSVTRQGITMTMLDSQEFLDQGKTGIAEVDAVLRQFNPAQAQRPARVFGRVTPPPTRSNTIQAD